MARPIEVVSLDSRQLYRRLDVGTGKPTAAERARLPHHLLDLIEPEQTFTAGRYRREVEAVLPCLWARGVIPLLVGGAGFYLRALSHGLVDIEDDPERLAVVRGRLAQRPIEELRLHLRQVDPGSASRLHPNDRYRIQRALEILELTGRSLSDWSASFVPAPVCGVQLRMVHLSPPRAELHRRISERTAAWVASGWREEVDALLQQGTPESAPGLRILGYSEVVLWATGRTEAARAQERIVERTRQYARQQEIWFRKLPAVARGDSGDASLRATLASELDAAGAWLDSGQGG